MADFGGDTYGLDPAIMAYLQGGGAPSPQQITVIDGLPLPGMPPSPMSPSPHPQMPIAASPPPPPPPPQQPVPLPAGVPSNLDPIAAFGRPVVSSPRREHLDNGGSSLPPEIANAINAGFQPPIQAEGEGGAHSTPPLAATPEGQYKQGEQGQLAAKQAEQDVTTQAGDVMSQQATDQARLLGERDDKLYGKMDPATGQRTGGILAEQQADQQKRAEELVKRQADLDKAISAEAKFKVDDGRRWSNLSTGRKILAGISLALSGLGDALQHKSEPNLALSIITGAIKDDVQSQVREREALGKRVGLQKSSIDNYRQMTNDLQQAGQMKIAEEYKRTADHIETTAAGYASPIAKLKAQQAAAELRGQAGQIIGNSALQLQGMADKKQEIGIQRGQLGIAQGHLSLAGKQFEQSKFEFGINKQLQEQGLALQALHLENEGNKAGAAALRAQQKEVLEGGIMMPTGSVQGPNGKLQPYYESLLNQDGKALVIPEKEREPLRKQFAGTSEAVKQIDELKALIAQNGGESAFFKTKAWQEAKSKTESILLAMHQAYGIEGFRGNVLDAMDQIATAGVDPTSYLRDATGALDQARKNITSKLNTDLHYRGSYTGKDVSFPDEAAAPAAAESKTSKDLQTLETVAPGGAADLQPPMGSTPEVYKAYGDARLVGLTPTQKSVLDAAAALGNKNFLSAVIEDKDALPATKKYARGLLGNDLAAELKTGGTK